MGTNTFVSAGLNYPGTDAELAGCVNDATEWAELLASQGYEGRVLYDAAATRDAILGALSYAVEVLGWSDRLVFTFSGHGTWVPDRDGDEADGRDEALCPADFRQGRLITDDDLQAVFSRVPRGASALVLSDSCHSGTLARFADLEPAVAHATPRFVPPTEVVEGLDPDSAARMEDSSSATPPRGSASLISGCADHEYSYDAWFGSRANGAMTRAAIDSFHPGISLSAWHREIRGRLPSGHFPQTPQLTASSLYRRYTRAL